MSFVAAAIVGGAVIGGVASNSAAGKQAKGQRQAARTQQRMFNTINQQEQPFIQSGYGAQNALNYLLGTAAPGSDTEDGTSPKVAAPSPRDAFGQNIAQRIALAKGDTTNANGVMPFAGTEFGKNSGLDAGYLTHQFNTEDFYNNLDPGYQFQLQQGQQAIRNASTPGVGALSGPALKELMSFNQGLASTSYQNAFNRFTTQQNNIFGRLSAIAGLGQNAATQVGTQGTALGQGIAQAQAAAAGSQAAGIVGAGNAIGGAGVPLAYLLSQNGGGLTNSPYAGSGAAAASSVPTGEESA